MNDSLAVRQTEALYHPAFLGQETIMTPVFRYERRSDPLLARNLFLIRVGRHVLLALGIMLLFLAVGMVGYHYFANLPWLDAVLNASMILSGMGPVSPLTTPAAKAFATVYALFSGLVFAFVTGIIISPILHRVFHNLHIEAGN